MLFLNITRNEAKIPEVIEGGVLGWFRLTDFSFENFHEKENSHRKDKHQNSRGF